MNDWQVALIAAAITCGTETTVSEVADIAGRYLVWLRSGEMP